MIYSSNKELKNSSSLAARAIASIYEDIPMYMHQTQQGSIDHVVPVPHIINEIYYKGDAFGKAAAKRWNLDIYALLEMISYYRNNTLLIYRLILDQNEKDGFRTNGLRDPEEIPNWIIRMI